MTDLKKLKRYPCHVKSAYGDVCGIGFRGDVEYVKFSDVEELEKERCKFFEALVLISDIRNKDDGGDWDEITEARAIAISAISKARKQ